MFDITSNKNRPANLRSLVDRGGQRVIKDRRFFQYGVFSPDNRNWKDRRSRLDRRKFPRYALSDKIVELDSDKSEKFLFEIPKDTNMDCPLLPIQKASSKNPDQKEMMSFQKEYQPDCHSGPPKHWHLQDPLDEVYLSEMLKRNIDENAYIVYCIDTYNTYRLSDEQKTKFESFDYSALNNIRTNMYSRNDLLAHFKQK
mgnify:CR=1 FL=1